MAGFISLLCLLASLSIAESACSFARARYTRRGVEFPVSTDRVWCNMPNEGTILLTDGTGSQARRYECSYNWSIDDGFYRVEIIVGGRRFYGSTFGMNSSKSTALCQAKSHVMKLNPRNQNVRSEGHCDGTPPQPSAVVHVYPC